MRFRTIFLILAILLVAGFVALNVDEFTRPTMLSLGATTLDFPLGLIMLGLLVFALLVFLGSTLYMQSRYLLESRSNTRDLNAQRTLADKAEASRFTELRTYFEARTLAEQEAESTHESTLASRMAEQQQELLARMEQSDNSLAAYMGQLEDAVLRRNGVTEQSLLSK